MDKSSKSVTGDMERIVGETSNSSMDKCQEDREDQSTGVDRKIDIPEIQGSPELRRKESRTMAMRDDARKLKTATLDRMGKMFKFKSPQATLSTDSKHDLTDSAITNDIQMDEQSKKDKTNSLGRMLKLVDKNGEPRKLFPQSRTGSLSRILRRKSTGNKEDEPSVTPNHSGLFSRILNQWKSDFFIKQDRSGNGNPTEEPDLCVSTIQENKSLSAKPLSTSRVNHSSASTDPSQASSLPAASKDENFTAVGYSA